MPIIVRGEGCYLEDVERQALPRRARRPLLREHRLRLRRGDGRGRAAQMRELPFYTNWSYAHPRAIELASEVASLDAGRPQPPLLRLRRVRGRRVGVEARTAVLLRPRPTARARGDRDVDGVARPRRRGARHQHERAPLEGHFTQRRVSRDDDGRALDQRHPSAARAVRAARAGGAARAQHEPLPPARGRDRGRVHRVAPRRSRPDDRGGWPGDGLRW